jgi:hypothetical protein
LKGGVWPSLPANASDRKDSFSTTTGAHIDRAHQPTRGGSMAKIIRGLGREGGLRILFEHFRTIKMFYRNEGV